MKIVRTDGPYTVALTDDDGVMYDSWVDDDGIVAALVDMLNEAPWRITERVMREFTVCVDTVERDSDKERYAESMRRLPSIPDRLRVWESLGPTGDVVVANHALTQMVLEKISKLRGEDSTTDDVLYWLLTGHTVGTGVDGRYYRLVVPTPKFAKPDALL